MLGHEAETKTHGAAAPAASAAAGKRPSGFPSLVLHLHPRVVPEAALRFPLTFGLGGAALVLFLLLAVTGALLLVAYEPSPERAYGTVAALVDEVHFGAFLRNTHYWAANGLVLVSVLHLLRVFYRGGHLPPRRGNWIVGVQLLLLVVASAFTGYLLPWDQLAFWAVTMSTGMLQYVPLVGAALMRAARGGAEIGPTTLGLLPAGVLPYAEGRSRRQRQRSSAGNTGWSASRLPPARRSSPAWSRTVWTRRRSRVRRTSRTRCPRSRSTCTRPSCQCRCCGGTPSARRTRPTRPRPLSTSSAAAAKKDPVEFRRGLLARHPRHLAVLELAAKEAGWGKPLAQGKAGEKRGRGIAVHESFNSFVAQVVEVTVKADRSQIGADILFYLSSGLAWSSNFLDIGESL